MSDREGEPSEKRAYSKKICLLRLCRVVLVMSEPLPIVFIGCHVVVLVMPEIKQMPCQLFKIL